MGSTSDAGNFSLSRLEDCIRLCEKRNYPCFMGFLDEAQREELRISLERQKQIGFAFFGGHEDAERTVLGVFPSFYLPEEVEFPVKAMAFSYRRGKELSHRDVLGTLLSKGIKRESIGDILCGDGLSVAFVREEIAGYLESQVDRIGKEGVHITPDYAGELPVFREFLPITDTVASNRLDVVVKVLIRSSREQAVKRIVAGEVQINHRVVEDVSASVPVPAVVSVRGVGRFAVDEIGPQTQKGRFHFKARKYI